MGSQAGCRSRTQRDVVPQLPASVPPRAASSSPLWIAYDTFPFTGSLQEPGRHRRQ